MCVYIYVYIHNTQYIAHALNDSLENSIVRSTDERMHISMHVCIYLHKKMLVCMHTLCLYVCTHYACMYSHKQMLVCTY